MLDDLGWDRDYGFLVRKERRTRKQAYVLTLVTPYDGFLQQDVMENIETYVLDLPPSQADELQQVLELLVLRTAVSGFSLQRAKPNEVQLGWLAQLYEEWVGRGGVNNLPYEVITTITADSEQALQRRLKALLPS